jgi:hypothetical protein
MKLSLMILLLFFAVAAASAAEVMTTHDVKNNVDAEMHLQAGSRRLQLETNETTLYNPFNMNHSSPDFRYDYLYLEAHCKTESDALEACLENSCSNCQPLMIDSKYIFATTLHCCCCCLYHVKEALLTHTHNHTHTHTLFLATNCIVYGCC